MWLKHSKASLLARVIRFQPVALTIGLLMGYWASIQGEVLLLIGAIATLAMLPKMRQAPPREKLATAFSLLGLVLLLIPAAETAGVLMMVSSLLVRLRPPSFLPAATIDVGEDGVWDRRSKRWIPFHDIEKVLYDEPEIELIGPGKKRLAAWRQPENALSMLRELEAGAHAAHQASDPLRLGRGEMTTEAWLSDLERRFRGEEQYRRQALPLGPLVSALGDPGNRADVRAGAAFALLSAYPHEGLPIVRARLSDRSAPLLVAVARLLSPGIVDDDTSAKARQYLSPEERAAIETFAERRPGSRYRVAIDPEVGEPVQAEAECHVGPDSSVNRAGSVRSSVAG